MSNFVKLHKFRARKRTKIRISEVRFPRGVHPHGGAPLMVGYVAKPHRAHAVALNQAASRQAHRPAHIFERLVIPLRDVSDSERAYT